MFTSATGLRTHRCFRKRRRWVWPWKNIPIHRRVARRKEGRDNPRMARSDCKGRLIIICGLPGSGKTTLAREFETRLHAVRFEPDEWMEALALDLYDEQSRAKIEQLQWKLGRQLLSVGLTVIIEWGTWGRSE